MCYRSNWWCVLRCKNQKLMCRTLSVNWYNIHYYIMHTEEQADEDNRANFTDNCPKSWIITFTHKQAVILTMGKKMLTTYLTSYYLTFENKPSSMLATFAMILVSSTFSVQRRTCIFLNRLFYDCRYIASCFSDSDNLQRR